MTLDRVCVDRGLLVDGDTRLANDPCEYFDERVRALVGCSRLRCASCGAWVRGGPPGLTIKDGASIDAAKLYAAPSWAELPAFEQRAPALKIENRVRFYACMCSRWEATQIDRLANEHDSPNDPDLPWACAGHPPPELPITLGDLALAARADWAAIVRKILEGSCPRALELRHDDGDGPSVWLGWLYVYLRGLSAADDFSSAIADRIGDAAPLVVGRVLFFFARFPGAKGIDRLVARAESDVHRVAIGYPIPEHYKASTLWDVLAARLAQRTKGNELDARVDALVRRVLVLPLASLSHADLGSTSLVESERQLRARMGWDLNSELAKTWLDDYARLKASERIDVVADELGRSPGAFDDSDLRQFMADHILEIDAAAKGRWKLVMDRLSDWLHKPEEGHLIVVAGARVIQAKLGSADEFRAWIKARRSYGWVDNAWVLPLETMLEQR